PHDADAVATLGRVESIAGTDAARALALLERAVTLAPAQEDYRLMLAEELIRQREYSRATNDLDLLVASSSRVEIRELARRLLGEIVSRSNDQHGDDLAISSLGPSGTPAAGLSGSETGVVPSFRAV